MYMAIGQCGSILGSKIFPSTEGPQYVYEATVDLPGPVLKSDFCLFIQQGLLR